MSGGGPIIGLVPAAGSATRLGRLPCSKEIYPVGFERDADGEPRPMPICGELLKSMGEAGIERVLMVLRSGKWDIAERLGDGSEWGLDLAYLSVQGSRCVPETLDRCRGWIEGSDVALGFPDIQLRPTDALKRLATFHRGHTSAVSLGLFPTDQSWKADMVDVDEQGRARDIVIKDPDCSYAWTWSLAIWRPTVTELLGRWVAERMATFDPGATELYVGDVFRSVLEAGLEIRSLAFDDGRFRDVGTPEDLRRAVAKGAELT